MSEEVEEDVVNRLIERCNNCDSFVCIECGIVWTDVQAISNYTKKLQKELDKKDKVIDLMAEQLAGLTIFDMRKDEPLILGDKKDVKEYYYRKGEEEDE